MLDEVTMKLNIDPYILSALREDITDEDATTNSIIKDKCKGEVELICKQDGVICGLDVFKRTFTLLEEGTTFDVKVNEGDWVKDKQIIMVIRADIKTLLCAERTALNYLQRMSGIATYTKRVVSLLEGSNIKLLDTRKTSPNNRIFEKYAVKVGGGINHRFNLSDGILLKDNHISAAGGVKKAVEAAREYAPFVRKIEVECENIDMVKEAIEAKADIIMLDNMTDQQIRQSAQLIDGRAQIECSGNVTAENIERFKNLNIDFISSGALTHSAPIMDLSLKNLRRIK